MKTYSLQSQINTPMSEISELRVKLHTVEDERDLFKDKFEQLEGVVSQVAQQLEVKDRELHDLRNQLVNNEKNEDLQQEQPLSATDCEALKQAVKDLISQNEQKDMRIEELRKAIATYQRVEEIIMSSQSAHSRKSADSDAVAVRHHSASAAEVNSTSLSKTMELSAPPIPKRGISTQRSNSYDASKFNRIVIGENAGSDSKRKVSSISLPRDYGNRIVLGGTKSDKDTNEADVFTDDEDISNKPKKMKGLKRLFARMRRSTSQEVIGQDKMFKRGGVRATAGARLGGSRVINNNKYQQPQSDSFLIPFSEWSSDQVLIWLRDIGMSIYTNDCRKWCKSGQHMLEASQQEVEKHLKITNNLHRKKLNLALQAIKSGSTKDGILLGRVGTDWIAKWLDDIGLPQYKDQFYEAQMDGRMLNHITVDDLLYMKINNSLHHMSIRRGIQVLRTHNFNLGTLRRRPSLERTAMGFPSSTLNGSALKADSRERDVSLWTNHRVMEWLRMIDLSEYAANLRGSGVHGALIMLEPRFTVEHLANLLIIPTSKSLLRRHLSGHFVNLVGQQVQALKRETEQRPGMMLTLNMKIKSKKPNPFRRGRPVSEYICPLEKVEPIELSPTADDARVKTAVAMYKREISKRESKKGSKAKPSS